MVRVYVPTSTGLEPDRRGAGGQPPLHWAEGRGFRRSSRRYAC